jgi:hypothetical protein
MIRHLVRASLKHGTQEGPPISRTVRRYGFRWALLEDGILVGVALSLNAAEAWQRGAE